MKFQINEMQCREGESRPCTLVSADYLELNLKRRKIREFAHIRVVRTDDYLNLDSQRLAMLNFAHYFEAL